MNLFTLGFKHKSWCIHQHQFPYIHLQAKIIIYLILRFYILQNKNYEKEHQKKIKSMFDHLSRSSAASPEEKLGGKSLVTLPRASLPPPRPSRTGEVPQKHRRDNLPVSRESRGKEAWFFSGRHQRGRSGGPHRPSSTFGILCRSV